MKGVIFTTDAFFALMIVAATVPMIIFATADRPDFTNQASSISAESSIYSLTELRLRNVIREPVIYDLYKSGAIREEDMNESVIDLITQLWASNSTQNITRAQNITKELLGSVLSPNMAWTFDLENDVLYDTGGEVRKTFSTGRRLASGFMKGENSSGYTAGMFLTSIGGKRAFAYQFFGGFVGQGNLTALIKDIPQNATVNDIYLELSPGSDFTFFVNGNNCGRFNKTGGITNATITGSCIGYVNAGATNILNFTFADDNIQNQYIGGGFVRISYTTDELLPEQQDREVMSLPGMSGIINYYGSFYAGRNITSMEMYLHINNNYSTFVNIGNVTVRNTTGRSGDESIFIDNTTLGMLLNYSKLSMTTVPLRIGVGIMNGTSGDGNADVILITDSSGSMAWNFTCESGCNSGVDRSCSDANLYRQSTRRISVAKCLDREFVSIILNNTGNRIGLVTFSDSADDYVDLASDNTTLFDAIDNYQASGSTCVACAINRAYSILNAQSNKLRKQFIVVMTDGVANVRATDSCENLYGAAINSSTAFAAGANGEIIKKQPGIWNSIASPISSTIYDVDLLNSTYGFAVGGSGKILIWNGIQWASVASPVSSTLYGVDIYNSTFALAVGSSGRVIRWNGASWATAATISNSPTLYSVSIWNQSLIFSSGRRSSSGRVYKSGNSGSTWTEDNNSGSFYYGIKILNKTRAFAVGTGGDILRWNGTFWNFTSSPTSDDLYSIDAVNSTYAIATGGNSGNSVILRYNGNNWSLAMNEAGDSLRNVATESAYALAAGMGSALYEFNGSTWTRNFSIPLAYSGNLTTGITCSADQDSCSEPDTFPGLNANYSSCRAHKDLNSTVHSIGFGPVTTCPYAQQILMGIASCGNGTYHASNDTEALKEIYKNLAEEILTQNYYNQSSVISTNITSTLYPDSYLAFNLTAEDAAPYQEIATDVETNRFNNCNYTFFIPSQLKIEDIKVTSFSGPLWTSNVTINSSKTGGQLTNVYSLSKYGKNFVALGDPFIVNIKPELIAPGENNTVSIHLGSSGANASIDCPSNSTVIYKARFKASVPYGSVFPKLQGGVVRIYYDIDHDGISDGYTDVTYGSDLPNFDPVPKTVDHLEGLTNALDDSIIRLLNTLNLVTTAGNSGLSGSQSNPIDVRLNDVQIETTSIAGVPYEWGPIDIRLDVKI